MKPLQSILIILSMLVVVSCERFLELKPDKSLAVPSTLRDLQSLLDNYSNVNSNTPGTGELASDDLYLLDDVWVARSVENQRCYIWTDDYNTTYLDWLPAYRVVYYANIVLDVINEIEQMPNNKQQWENVKGQAHFLRASSFLHIANIWALAFDEKSADTDLGIPLRLGADFNELSERASVRDTYKQIISDLNDAIELLPEEPEHVVRASKPAALALLARTYLFMRDYENCLVYADKCLELKSDLMDFNKLDSTVVFSIPEFNPEVIYHSTISTGGHPSISVDYGLVDTVLLASYSEGDLRKSLFFRTNDNGTSSFTGNYSGTVSRFSGVAVNEVLLMRLECLARLGRSEEALPEMNDFLLHRYKEGEYVPFDSGSPKDVLQFVLDERRKELLMRGLRFPDVKRRNKEGANISFKRVINENEYILPPNDPKFAVSIPEQVVELAPLVLQNYR